MFAVIMAGGGGTRLWPKSRESFPKQMHVLCGEKPLVQGMTELLQDVVGVDQVYIITNAHHAMGISRIMPWISDRILIDPYRRDTAAAIGLAAVYLSRVDPGAVMGVFPADHFIADTEEFGRVVKAAENLAAKGKVVTIGITPTGPETGYGYIEYTGQTETADGKTAYHVSRFVEKPNRETAEEYLKAGNYLWNSGMFVWSIPTVLALFKEHLPGTYERLMRISDALGTDEEADVVDREYQAMERISVDYGIMEKLKDILVIPGNFGWNDIGSWKTVAEVAQKDEQGNTVNAQSIRVDTENCLIVGETGKMIATIGVKDLVVIDTPDALLICNKDRTQDVKKVVDKLKEEHLQCYL
ncbi:MAG: mannose-1-phosphate guanylyltransferase [Armatimonadota bacterium]|nr:mannose-1-phosphate guanylyltransferase [Armatimonadota bacterium]